MKSCWSPSVFNTMNGALPHIWGKLFYNMERDMYLSIKKGTSRNYKLSNP